MRKMCSVGVGVGVGVGCSVMRVISKEALSLNHPYDQLTFPRADFGPHAHLCG